MKFFISQLAAGHTDMANLIARDGVQTRQYIQHSEARMKQSMRTFQDDANKELNRERLLRSLKYESMNSRRTELKLAHEATYVSIFKSLDMDEASYTAPISSSAVAWRKFVQWLQSDKQAFWIQGKPGAGKSTLMKFLLQHKNTQRGVNKWSPNTLIVSHFFWKSGDILQKNLRGFLCSLIHQLLSNDHTLIDHILSRFLLATDKDTIGDWEISELESVFHSILIQGKRSTFFLLDGLDEATETEEMLQFLDSFIGMNNIKICLSSRGEDVFLQKFSKYDGFELNELTEDDMLQFVLTGIPETDRYPSDFLDGLRRLLVQKAEGVYLWLVIALESVKRGIRNNDEQHEIYLRLSKLPSKLEELYEDMWSRLGEDRHIYQKEAVRYFSLLIMNQSLIEQYNNTLSYVRRDLNWGLSPFQLMLTTNEKIKGNMLDKSYPLSVSEMSKRCADTMKSLTIKTAGFLTVTQFGYIQFYPLSRTSVKIEFLSLSDHLTGKISFIHRTLFDFFKESEVGKAIFAQNQKHSSDLELGAIILCQLRIMETTRYLDSIIPFDHNVPLHYFLWILAQLVAEESVLKNKEIMNLLHTASDLFESGLLPWDDRPEWYPRPTFDSLVIEYPVFEKFIKSRIEEKGPSHTTCLLRDLLLFRASVSADDQQICDTKGLILSLGGDINSLGICLYKLPSILPSQYAHSYISLNLRTRVDFARYESILGLIIKRVHKTAVFHGRIDCEFMQYMVAALKRGPILNQHTTLVVEMKRSETYSGQIEINTTELVDLLATMVSPRKPCSALDMGIEKSFVIMEVNLKYLVKQLFESFPSHAEDKEKHLINCARQLSRMDDCKPFVKALFFIHQKKPQEETCYRFINPNNDILAGSIINTEPLPIWFPSIRTIKSTILDNYLRECEKVDVSTLSVLLNEKLGVCLLEDMGIKLPSSRGNIWSFNDYRRVE